MELLASVGLIFNLLPRVAVALAVTVLPGASYAVVRMQGWNRRWNKSGPEYMFF